MLNSYVPQFDHLRLESIGLRSCLRTPFDQSEYVRLRQDRGPIRPLVGEGKLDAVDEPAKESPNHAASLVSTDKYQPLNKKVDSSVSLLLLDVAHLTLAVASRLGSTHLLGRWIGISSRNC